MNTFRYYILICILMIIFLGRMLKEYKDSIALLNKGYAIRDVAKLTGKGVSNIQRVKKQFSYEVFLPSCRFGNTNNTVLLLQKDKLDMPFCDKTS